ncbi:TRAP transporter substrate-binding protein [Georgenia sp. MJ206]|uniref:TRAP transporter substrate-binding protein n=1 Tax=Georgenia wangjunii TaxID=3117730 RepID=UPI002F26B0AB
MTATKTIRWAGALGVASLLLAACGGPSDEPADGASGTGDGREIPLSLNQTEEHPNFLALSEFAENVAERTEGRVNIRVFPNAVLGEQQESVQLVGDGSVGMASISAPQMVNLNEDFMVLDMPLVFDSEEHQMATINDMEIVGELYSSLADSQSLTVLGAYTQGARSVYNSRGPIETPEDLAGLKVRVQESPLHIAMIQAMGGTPTPMPFSEVYTALQGGVIDAAENNAPSYLTQRHYETAPYFSYTNHLIGADFLVVNSELLASFSEEDRAVVEEEFAASVETFMSIWQEQVAAAIEETTAAGAQYNEVDAEAFREVLQPVVDDALETETQRELFEAIRDRA